MKTNLLINGQIMAVIKKEYNDEETIYVQFMTQSEKKGFEIIKVKMTIEKDYSKLQENLYISIPIAIVNVGGVLYYSQLDEMKVIREAK